MTYERGQVESRPAQQIDYIIGGRLPLFPSNPMRTLDNMEEQGMDEMAHDPLPTVAEEQEQDVARVPLGVVQREWDETVRRIKEVCEVKDLTSLVSARQYAHILIRKTDVLDVARVEGILFENLLFSPWARVEHQSSYILSGAWLWKWRKKAPWAADPVGHMIRLAPDAPKRMWTYRMNVIDAG